MISALLWTIVGLLVVIVGLVVKLDQAKRLRINGTPFTFQARGGTWNHSAQPSEREVVAHPRGPQSFAGAEAFRELAGIPGPPQPVPSATRTELAALRQNLRVKLMYQEEKIDEAIESERKRNPNRSEVELMKAAIVRWERENA